MADNPVDPPIKTTSEEDVTGQISEELYEKAYQQQDQLSANERLLLLGRGDLVGRALAAPDTLTQEEINDLLGRPPPDVVRAAIQSVTGGVLSTPAELYAKTNAARDRHDLGSLSDDELRLMAHDFWQSEPGGRSWAELSWHPSGKYREVPGSPWAQCLLYDREGLDRQLDMAVRIRTSNRDTGVSRSWRTGRRITQLTWSELVGPAGTWLDQYKDYSDPFLGRLADDLEGSCGERKKKRQLGEVSDSHYLIQVDFIIRHLKRYADESSPDILTDFAEETDVATLVALIRNKTYNDPYLVRIAEAMRADWKERQAGEISELYYEEQLLFHVSLLKRYGMDQTTPDSTFVLSPGRRPEGPASLPPYMERPNVRPQTPDEPSALDRYGKPAWPRLGDRPTTAKDLFSKDEMERFDVDHTLGEEYDPARTFRKWIYMSTKERVRYEARAEAARLAAWDEYQRWKDQGAPGTFHEWKQTQKEGEPK